MCVYLIVVCMLNWYFNSLILWLIITRVHTHYFYIILHILLTSCWTAWLHALALPAHSRTLSDEEEWWWRSSVWSSLTSHRRSGVDRRMVQQIEAAACWAQPPHNAIYKLTRAVEDFFTFMPPQWWQRRADTQSQRSTTQGWVLNSQFWSF